jgi:hypothetical protein
MCYKNIMTKNCSQSRILETIDVQNVTLLLEGVHGIELGSRKLGVQMWLQLVCKNFMPQLDDHMFPDLVLNCRLLVT